MREFTGSLRVFTRLNTLFELHFGRDDVRARRVVPAANRFKARMPDFCLPIKKVTAPANCPEAHLREAVWCLIAPAPELRRPGFSLSPY